MPVRDDSWLSLTPEPERLLPEARAVLLSGAAPPPAHLVAAERARAERLVLGGRRARWQAWLRETAALAERHENAVAEPASPRAASSRAAEPASPRAASPPAASSGAAALVRDVVANHDALVLGLPGKRRSRR